MTTDQLTIRTIEDGDEQALIALWRDCDLLRPWNDPDHDIAYCRNNPQCNMFVGILNGEIVASIMAGNDGHRGVLYFVATSPAHRGKGFGQQMVRHGESWLQSCGVWKINLMIRDGNDAVQGFYQSLDYDTEPRTVMSRRLDHDQTTRQMSTLVTSLEMRTKPGAPWPPPPLENITVLRAHNPTAAFYRYLYTGVGEPWMWWQRSILSDRELLALIDPKTVEIYVLYVAGTPAGYFELDLKELPSIELAYFGLMPQFTGIKLGPYMMGLALETAWAHGPDRLWIHTCDMDHPAALTLYQRSGFEIFAEETETFDDPRLYSGNK